MFHSTNRKLIPVFNASDDIADPSEFVAMSLLCVSPPMLYEELSPETDENMGDEAFAYCLEDPAYGR